MEYEVGDTIRIIDDLSQAEEAWDQGMFLHKGCEATIIRAGVINRKWWYELDIDPGELVWLASDFVQDEPPEVDITLLKEVIACGD